MRTHTHLVFAILFATILPCVADDLSGTWAIRGIGTPVCALTQSGDFYRGTCEGPGAKGTVVRVVDHEAIRWTYYWALKTGGNIGADVFNGHLDRDGAMSGLVLNTAG